MLTSFMCSHYQNTNLPHPQGQPWVTFRAYCDFLHQLKPLLTWGLEVLCFTSRMRNKTPWEGFWPVSLRVGSFAEWWEDPWKWNKMAFQILLFEFPISCPLFQQRTWVWSGYVSMCVMARECTQDPCCPLTFLGEKKQKWVCISSSIREQWWGALTIFLPSLLGMSYWQFILT